MTRFWGKLMLISFAVGVVTGIVQEFQFGMNWSTYSRYVGDVFGAPLAMEGLAAFFVESTFVGLWLFGRGRLSPGVHLATIWASRSASMLSAYFIIAANSWMQHPVGSRIDADRAGAADLDLGRADQQHGDLVVRARHLRGAHHGGPSSPSRCRDLAPAPRPRGRRLHRGGARRAADPRRRRASARCSPATSWARCSIEQQPMKMAAAEALLDTEQPAAFSLFATGPLTCTPRTRAATQDPAPALAAGHAQLERQGRRHQPGGASASTARNGPGEYAPSSRSSTGRSA